MANLADLLIRTDRADEARLTLQLNTMGTLADAQGQHAEALELYRRAALRKLD